MNILFTESSPNIGGQELQAVAQMNALKKMGHTVLLACREDSKIALEASKFGIDTIFASFRNSLHIPTVKKILRIIHDFQPNAIICHSGHDSNIVGFVRLFTWRHPFRVIRQKTYLTKKTNFFSINYFCDEVIVPGTSMKAHMVQNGCRTRITVVPPGFDFHNLYVNSRNSLPPKVLAWLKSGKDIPVIAQIGMLRPEKGHKFMLNLLLHLKMSGRQFRWLIVGSGSPEQLDHLQYQIDTAGMQNDAFIADNIFPAAPVYRVANLVVLPSENESFGMVLAEASVFSVPVLASQTGGISDVIHNNQTGTLLPVGNEHAWLCALNKFFNAPEHFYQMARLAKQDIEERFDINKTVLKILALAKYG
ncbi:glycosyltransferase family 4 protein [Escherichia coli]|nr:glycosyltransferase family 4 protein [Escherichia coli]